jgi:hypothetical protein
MPDPDATQRFDALLEAMVTKPPLKVDQDEPAPDDDDKREPEEN